MVKIQSGFLLNVYDMWVFLILYLKVRLEKNEKKTIYTYKNKLVLLTHNADQSTEYQPLEVHPDDGLTMFSIRQHLRDELRIKITLALVNSI